MWQLINHTPFAPERSWARDRRGAEVWLVAVKCTWKIRSDGSTEIATCQPPALRAPQHYGDPANSSLRYDTDLVLTKQTTDVILVGHAYSPTSKPVTQLDVGFRCGTVTKVLRVYGDRIWRGSGYSPPRPFERMPLIYERAYGGPCTPPDAERGWDRRNPVGTGYATRPTDLLGAKLPNIEYPNQLVTKKSDQPAPASFGAIAAHWQPRVKLAGTYDDSWMRQRRPLLPDDFDDRFFQSAPADQQAPRFLRGGEKVILRNLTPEGDLQFHLPRVSLSLETYFYDGTQQPHDRPELHTVIFEPDIPRVSLVWHSALQCHSKVQKLDSTVVRVKPVVPLGSRHHAEAAAEPPRGRP